MHTTYPFGPAGTNVGVDFDQSMQACIEACLVCYQTCTELIPHCLHLGRDFASPETIGLLTCCASLCETSARFMMHDSAFHRSTCELCARVCRSCAEMCEDLSENDPRLRECMDDCLSCAEHCERMARH